MRVIAGIAKGHKLQAPEGIDIRPTTDRIKETLFNILSPDLMDCRFLDLFSGTGSIGIEALSRGAKTTVFVDQSMDSKKIIDYNLLHTKLYEKAKIYTENVLCAVKRLGEIKEKFDIIFMDPPYNKDYVYETLTTINTSNIIDSKGYIVIEHETNEQWKIPKEFNIFKEKVYKKTTMTFIEKI